VGVAATTQILDELRKRVARKELNDVNALLEALHAAMLDILKPVEQPLAIDPGSSRMSSWCRINGAGKTTTIGKLAHRLLADGTR